MDWDALRDAFTPLGLRGPGLGHHGMGRAGADPDSSDDGGESDVPEDDDGAAGPSAGARPPRAPSDLLHAITFNSECPLLQCFIGIQCWVDPF